MSAFQSTWGNTQQNQQQQPNAFGQPSGFGTSGTSSRDKPSNTILNLHVAFGGSSAFGQNQQQQPAANPMFGNLGGTPNTNTGTAGFGAFYLIVLDMT
jgi:nuclear pore complex protein Nup98-Nup96